MDYLARIAFVLALASLWITSFGAPESAAAPFRNLDFEDAVITGPPGEYLGPEALPYWTHNDPQGVIYDGVCLAAGCVSIHDSESWFFAPPAPLQGEFSVLLQGPATDWEGVPLGPLVMSQVGDIPSGLGELRLLAWGYGLSDPGYPDGPYNLEIAMNGVNIPLDVLSTVDGVSTLSGDISAFAATTAELTISSGRLGGVWAEPYVMIDDIRIVPEPGTVSLLGLGLVGLTVAARRRRG